MRRGLPRYFYVLFIFLLQKKSWTSVGGAAKEITVKRSAKFVVWTSKKFSLAIQSIKMDVLGQSSFLGRRWRVSDFFQNFTQSEKFLRLYFWRLPLSILSAGMQFVGKNLQNSQEKSTYSSFTHLYRTSLSGQIDFSWLFIIF